MQMVRKIKGQPHVVKLGNLTVTAQTAALLRAIHRGTLTRADIKRIEKYEDIGRLYA